jgi:hypothetical protein
MGSAWFATVVGRILPAGDVQSVVIAIVGEPAGVFVSLGGGG